MTLEDKLMDDVRNGKQIDIERALLIASGCETEEKVSEYKTKLNEIEKQFHGYASARNVQGEVETAKALHEFLWLGKIEEDYVRECSNLVDMIEVIMHSQTMGEGDCVGLSSLLGALGARQGLEFTVLYNTIHVLSRLRVGEKVIDIETISPIGFDIPTHHSLLEGYKGLREGKVTALIASLYCLKGVAKRRLGRFEEAIRDYDKAIELNPDSAAAYNNRGVAKYYLGRLEEAIADYSKAIEIVPYYTLSYANRSMPKSALGDIEGCKEDVRIYRQLLRNAA